MAAFTQKILESNQKRESLFGVTDAYRVVNGASDGFPGVTLDRFGNRFQVQFFGVDMLRDRARLVDSIAEAFPAECIVVKERLSSSGKSLENAPMEVAFGSRESAVGTVFEGNAKFHVDLLDTINPGLFLDMRHVRLEVEERFREMSGTGFASACPLPSPSPVQHSSAQPSSAQSSFVQPSSAQHSSAQPSSAQPSFAQPSFAQPSSAQPSFVQPSSAQPSSSQPSGLRFLNLFSYTCSFSVHARLGGAAVATNADISGKILDKGRENYALNGLDLRPGEFFRGNALEYVRWALKKGLRFDGIVLDPPSFARFKGFNFNVREHLFPLVAECAGILNPGGFFMVSSNYSEFNLQHFAADVRRAVASVHPSAKTEWMRGQDVDFNGSGSTKDSCLVATLVEV